MPSHTPAVRCSRLLGSTLLVVLSAWLAACSGSDENPANGAGGGTSPGASDAGTSSDGATSSNDATVPNDAGDSSADAGVLPRLKLSGKDVLGPDGNKVALRGYNWGQWGTAQAQDGADNLAQGATVVRLPLRWWGEWKPGVDSRSTTSPGHIDPAHLAVLDQAISWATSQHLWVVLFLDSNYGQGAEGRTDNFWTNAPMKQEFVEVWQFLVARYASTPYIGAFELLPEPKPTGFDDAAVKAFYDSLIPSVRALDTKTPIIVGPNDGYDFKRLEAAYTTVDSNIIYTGNYFIFDHELSKMKHIEDFHAAHNVPVWVNQVGIQSGDVDAATKAANVLGGLNTRGVGWAWWTYRAQTNDPNQHGIYYSDPADDTKWIAKPTWLALIGQYL